MLDKQTDSGSVSNLPDLFEAAYSHLNPQLNGLAAHVPEVTGPLILGAAILASLALRRAALLKVEAELSANSLGKGVLEAADVGVKKSFDPQKYQTVAAEVQAFRRRKNLAGEDFFLTHDSRGHCALLKPPATPGGEGYAALAESYLKQTLDQGRKYPLFHEGVERYNDVLIILRRGGHPAPRIPEQKLKEVWDLCGRRMEENFKLWGTRPQSSRYEHIKDLPVPRWWS